MWYGRLGGPRGRSDRVWKISPPTTGIRFTDLPARKESLRHPGPHLMEKTNHWAPNYTVSYSFPFLSTLKAHLSSSQPCTGQPSDLQLTGNLEFLILFSTRTVGEVRKENAAKWDTRHSASDRAVIIELPAEHVLLWLKPHFSERHLFLFQSTPTVLYTYLRDGNCIVQRYFTLSKQQYFGWRERNQQDATNLTLSSWCTVTRA